MISSGHSKKVMKYQFNIIIFICIVPRCLETFKERYKHKIPKDYREKEFVKCQSYAKIYFLVSVNVNF